MSIAPIKAGMVGEWREFVAELRGPRRIEWAQSQRRRGITRQVVSLTEGEPALSVVYTESRDATTATTGLNGSTTPFDVWYRDQIERLHETALPAEVVFDSAPRPGPWRGWR